jgi:hypothetical protein
MKRVIAAVALMSMLAAGTANAALSEYTQTFSFDDITTPYTLTLNIFDPALGTLSDITLTIVTNITPQVQLINFTDSSQSFTNAQSTSPFALNGPGSVVVNATASTN